MSGGKLSYFAELTLIRRAPRGSPDAGGTQGDTLRQRTPASRAGATTPREGAPSRSTSCSRGTVGGGGARGASRGPEYPRTTARSGSTAVLNVLNDTLLAVLERIP